MQSCAHRRNSTIQVLVALGLTLGLSAVMAASPANATTIVDTGTPPTPAADWLNLFDAQFLAGQFTLADNTMITDIEGWIWGVDSAPGSVEFVIYGDDDNLPDLAAELFRGESVVPAGAAADWYGVGGLSLNLAAGTYWVAFEVSDPLADFFGRMPKAAPSPLARYAVASSGGAYLPQPDGTALGVRINGAVVPEPTTLTLMGMGLAGMAAARSRKKRAS